MEVRELQPPPAQHVNLGVFLSRKVLEVGGVQVCGIEIRDGPGFFASGDINKRADVAWVGHASQKDCEGRLAARGLDLGRFPYGIA
jgi:hypothetical protein